MASTPDGHVMEAVCLTFGHLLAWCAAMLAFGGHLAGGPHDSHPAGYAERAARGIHQAIEAGALRFLGSNIVQGAFFEDELSFQKELYVQTLHQLLMGFLDAEPGRYIAVSRL